MGFLGDLGSFCSSAVSGLESAASGLVQEGGQLLSNPMVDSAICAGLGLPPQLGPVAANVFGSLSGSAGGQIDPAQLAGLPSMVSPGNWSSPILGAISGSGGFGGITGGLTGILGGSSGGGMPSFSGAMDPTQAGVGSAIQQQQQMMNWANAQNLAIQKMMMCENLIQKIIDNIGSLGR